MHGIWRGILLIFLAAVSIPAVAQSTFLGISLDARFPGGMAECPTKDISGMRFLDTDRLKDGTVCFEKQAGNRYHIWNAPDLGIGAALTVETYEEKPLSFELVFSKTKYTQAVEIFAARFGKPQKTFRETISTLGGTPNESRSTIWSKGKLRIALVEVGKDVRWSDGFIVNSSLADEKINRDREAAKSAAGKL